MTVEKKGFSLNGKESFFNFGIGIAGLIFGCVAFVQSNDNVQDIQDLKPLSIAVQQLDKDSAVLSTKVESLLKDDFLTVRDIETYIMDHPTVVLKSLTKFRMEQEASGASAKQPVEAKVDISAYKDQLLNDPISPVIGNPNGKHVITLFADYNCGYCKMVEPAFDDWLRVDPEAKLIVKEFPILQPATSMSGALLGVGLYQIAPEKYAQFHTEMMAAKPLTEEAVNAIMAKMGVSVEAMKNIEPVAKKQIAANHTLAAQLKVTGTPTFFINGVTRSGGGRHTVESLMAFFE